MTGVVVLLRWQEDLLPACSVSAAQHWLNRVPLAMLAVTQLPMLAPIHGLQHVQQGPTCGCALPLTSLNWSLVLAGSEASTALRLEVRPDSLPVMGEDALPMFHPGRALGVPAAKTTNWSIPQEHQGIT